MSNSIPPPPHHPAATTTSTSTTTASEPVSSGGIGKDVESRVKGLFGTINSAGEAIRGTINSTLDGVGDGISNRNSGAVVDRNHQVAEDNVAKNGVESFKDNLHLLVDGNKSGHTVGSGAGTGTGGTTTTETTTTQTRDANSHVAI